MYGSARATLKSIKEEIHKYTEKPAAIIAEIARNIKINVSEISQIMLYCKKQGVLFIIDEVTSGFRMCFGGYHSNFGLTPDAVVYGKTLSSGIPFSALVCNDNLAEGIKKSFISSAYWSDSLGVAAAYSTLSILERRGNHLYPHINAVGSGIS